MKGAKGVIISIIGGEDMRLMEVDEAANHIRELVDPDANIIWGSAFNPDLEGKIRVSVVATGIGAEEVMPMPQPAKVFAFPARAPAARRGPRPSPQRDDGADGDDAGAAHPHPARGDGGRDRRDRDRDDGARHRQIAETPETAAMTETMAETTDLAAEDEGDELLLDSFETAGDETATTMATDAESADMPPAATTRSWLTREEMPAETQAPSRDAPGRDAVRAHVEHRPRRRQGAGRGGSRGRSPGCAPTGRDPLDIPRFLNRQNNQ